MELRLARTRTLWRGSNYVLQFLRDRNSRQQPVLSAMRSVDGNGRIHAPRRPAAETSEPAARGSENCGCRWWTRALSRHRCHPGPNSFSGFHDLAARSRADRLFDLLDCHAARPAASAACAKRPSAKRYGHALIRGLIHSAAPSEDRCVRRAAPGALRQEDRHTSEQESHWKRLPG